MVWGTEGRAERFGSASEQNRSEYAFVTQKVPYRVLGLGAEILLLGKRELA